MIPPASSPVWKRFATGDKPMHSPKLAINLLAKNVEISYVNDPSPENVQHLALRIYKFFVQYELPFADELTRLMR